MGLWLKTTNGVVEINSDGSGVPDAPEDGKQYARQDAAWSEVEAAEVLRGDPNNPPADWATDQLLYDGVEDDSSSGGGGAGPHDHDEYALVEHDHDEFAPVEHDHATENIRPEIVSIKQGPFPENLVGMPGMERRDATGSIQMVNRSNATLKIGPDVDRGSSGPVYNGYIIETGDPAHNESASLEPISIIGRGGLYLFGGGPDVGAPVSQGTLMLDGNPQVTGDLKVDGTTTIRGSRADVNLSALVAPPADHWTTYPGVWADYGMHTGTQGGYMTSVTNNGYRNTDSTWKSLGVNGQVGAAQIDLAPTGAFYVRVASNYPTGSASSPPTRFAVTEASTTVSNTFNPAGGTTFGITEGIDTRDVLERAETATMPAIDEEGVAAADVKGVMLNDVVTALLLKVKELSARIEELEGA